MARPSEVNAEREANVVPTINAVWLHGGGRWKPLPPIEFTQVHSDAAELRGVAHACRCASRVGARASGRINALIVLDERMGRAARAKIGMPGCERSPTSTDGGSCTPADSIDLVLCWRLECARSSRDRQIDTAVAAAHARRCAHRMTVLIVRDFDAGGGAPSRRRRTACRPGRARWRPVAFQASPRRNCCWIA